MEKKVMSDYSLFCTQEQTKKAYELGAPIKKEVSSLQLYGCVRLEEKDSITGTPYWLMPTTAEQMIGWLEEQGIYIHTEAVANSWRYYVTDGIEYIRHESKPSRKEATLAAIDSALDYLEKR